MSTTSGMNTWNVVYSQCEISGISENEWSGYMGLPGLWNGICTLRLDAFLGVYIVMSIKSFKKKWEEKLWHRHLPHKCAETAGWGFSPTPRHTGAGWGHRPGKPITFWQPPLTDYPRWRGRSTPLSAVQRTESATEKRVRKMRKSPGWEQLNAHRWDTSGTLPESQPTFTAWLSSAVVCYFPLTDRGIGLQELCCGSQIISGGAWIEKSQLGPNCVFFSEAYLVSILYFSCLQFANYFSIKFLGRSAQQLPGN